MQHFMLPAPEQCHFYALLQLPAWDTPWGRAQRWANGAEAPLPPWDVVCHGVRSPGVPGAGAGAPPMLGTPGAAGSPWVTSLGGTGAAGAVFRALCLTRYLFSPICST